MSNPRKVAAALAFALCAATATQSSALPLPPMLEAYNPPLPLPPCFANQAAAIAWINTAYDKLLVIAHDQQAMSAYEGQLQMAAIDARYGHGGTEAQVQAELTSAQGADTQLAAARAALEATIQASRNVPYCAVRAAPVRVVIGFATEGLRRTTVTDNRDGTRTVDTDDGEGHTTSEVRRFR